MSNNRSYFNNAKRPRYYRDPSTPRIASSWRYNGEDKSEWNFFIQKRNESFLKSSINYINDPDEVENRKREPETAEIIAIGLREDRAQENRRRIEQDRINRAYGKAQEKWEKDKRLMEEHFGLAITIVAELCSSIIKSDLYSHINGAEFITTNNETKYEAVSQRLLLKYGPHNQGDVEALRNILINLNGDETGWQRAIQVFDQTITSMEMTLQRDEHGNPIFDEIPVIYPTRPDVDAEEEAWHQYRFNLQDAVDEAQNARGPPKNYRPTDLQLKEYLLEALRRSRVSKYYKICDEAVLARNINWTYQQIRQDVSDLADREAQDNSRQLAGRSHFDPETIRLRSSNSSSSSSFGQRTHKSHREYEGGRRYKNYKRSRSAESDRHDQRSKAPRSRSRSQSADRRSHSVTFDSSKCLNCGEEGHMVKDCPSPKCGNCGDEFPTAELRRSHWGKNHARNAKAQYKYMSEQGRRQSYSSNRHSSRTSSSFVPQSRGREASASDKSRSRSRSGGRTPYRKAYYQDSSDYSYPGTADESS